MRKFIDVRRDIVHTIRQVPQRWASKASSGAAGGVGPGAPSALGMGGGEREGLR